MYDDFPQNRISLSLGYNNPNFQPGNADTMLRSVMLAQHYHHNKADQSQIRIQDLNFRIDVITTVSVHVYLSAFYFHLSKAAAVKMAACCSEPFLSLPVESHVSRRLNVALPFVTSCKRRPFFLGGHWLFDGVVVPTVPGVAVAVTVAATLGQGNFSVALPASFLPQLVSVVLDVRLLLQPPVVYLGTIHPQLKTSIILNS